MKSTVKIIPFILLVIALAFNVGCGVGGGANVRLEGVSLGTVTVDGKPVAGLPSQEIDVLLAVSTREIDVDYSADGVILTLDPSGATLEMSASGILIRGLKPEQVKVEWAVSE